MALTLADVEFLQSSAGQRWLDELATGDLSERNTLSLLTHLRRNMTPEQAGVVLTMARLRLAARDKFGEDAGRMLFTRDGLQQASDPLVRRYRASLLSNGVLVDAGCGIGADSIAYARAGLNVTGIDLDAVRVAIARHNAVALDVTARFHVGDVRDGLPADADTVFFDPARRDEQGRRIFDVEQYRPPLSTINSWDVVSKWIKLSPGVQLPQLEPYGGVVRFISVHGDLKEAVLGIGTGGPAIQAILLHQDAVYVMWREVEPDVSIMAPRRWLVEPDPSLLRAGLVEDIAVQLDGSMLDESIAYFTTDQYPESPWVRAWEILDWMPFHLKKLRAYLREHQVRRVTVKKRGFPMSPEEIIARLKLKKGTESRTLVFTRLQGDPIVIICRDFLPIDTGT